jgi:hypothetical protein
MSTTIQRQAANGLFGKEHAGIVEEAIKENRSKNFHAKLQRIAFNFAADLSESVSGIRDFSMEDLDNHHIKYRNTLEAGRLIDTMKREIKTACKERGDFWYTVELDETNWEIEAYRGKAK